MKRSHVLFLTVLLAFSFTGAALSPRQAQAPHQDVPASPVQVLEPAVSEERFVESVPEPKAAVLEPPISIPALSVPFTSQAPFARWSDDTFQNGCEEASLVMAAYWLSGKPLTKEIAEQEIVALSVFERKTRGHAVDTSAADTAALFHDYYEAELPEARYDITVADIRAVLSEGAIVIVPTNGRKLGNPNFKSPGPLTHMLVIIGYDAEQHEFIVNDPGTRLGKSYRYDESVLLAAIRDYPTGKHLPIIEERTAMIVIWQPEKNGVY